MRCWVLNPLRFAAPCAARRGTMHCAPQHHELRAAAPGAARRGAMRCARRVLLCERAAANRTTNGSAFAAPVPAALTETHTAAVGPSYTHAFGAAHYEAHTATVGPAHASASASANASALVGSVPTTHTEGLGQIELTGWLSCTSSMGTCLEWQ